MKAILALLSGLVVVGVSGTVYASDTSKALDDDHLNIRSMMDPDQTISKQDTVALVLPANPTVADKQLLALLKMNIEADGVTVTTSDKARWTIIASIRDQFTRDTYYKQGFFSPSTMVETTDYATISVVLFRSGDLNNPIWASSVYTQNDNWVNNQQKIVEAIVATYGANFYYVNVDPDDVPSYFRRNKDQPSTPSAEEIRSIWWKNQQCDSNPSAKGC